jgi:adenosylcobinamide kinase / adenosylcobinamide-phosphate guanylyltransferase
MSAHGEVWLVTGGARSGKSTFAESLAAATGLAVVYFATLEPLDEEMRSRVAIHRARRAPSWRTVEAPRDLVQPLRAADAGACAVIDCLSVWTANRLLAAGGEEPTPEAAASVELALSQAVGALLDVAAARGAPTIVVTNEVGSGVVPPTALGRVYRDLLGRVNQLVSARAARAWLLVAGRALELPPQAPAPTNPA